jgi:hypothetical protein
LSEKKKERKKDKGNLTRQSDEIVCRLRRERERERGRESKSEREREREHATRPPFKSRLRVLGFARDRG